MSSNKINLWLFFGQHILLSVNIQTWKEYNMCECPYHNNSHCMAVAGISAPYRIILR